MIRARLLRRAVLPLPLAGALALALLGAMPTAWAQANDGALPAEPAAAPPAPARLDATPGSSSAATPSPSQGTPAGAPLPGLESLPDGAWRLRFPTGTSALPPRADATLASLGRRLADRIPDPQARGRFTLIAQASGPANDISAARRLSLARALAVKAALAAGGLPETRIDVRPLGRTEEALDAVDVLPPEPPRPAPAAAPAPPPAPTPAMPRAPAR